MFLGKMVTEISKDLKMLKRAEDTFDMNPKDVKKITAALKQQVLSMLKSKRLLHLS